MSLSAAVRWGITANGAATAGGGFDPTLTTGMLTDGAATSATGSAPVFSSASYSFVAGDVNGYVYVASGTNWTPGYYPIVSVSAGAATLAAAVDATRGGALSLSLQPLAAVGCATTASPTGATWSVDYSWRGGNRVQTTDLISTASTTVTSVGALFVPVLVGNLLRLLSATGAPVADSGGSRYFAVTAYGSTTSITLDRVSGTYTAGSFQIGGAFADINCLLTGGSRTAPALTSALAPGHQIMLRGAGTADPSTMDYDWSSGYMTFPGGNATAGAIRLIGYNGRPGVTVGGLLLYQLTYWSVDGVKFKATGASNGDLGIICGANASDSQGVKDCIFDSNGNDLVAVAGMGVIGNWCKNGGSTSAGTYPAFDIYAGSAKYGAMVRNNFVNGWRGGGTFSGNGGDITENVFANCHGTTYGCIHVLDMTLSITVSITRNTVYNHATDGIRVADASAVYETFISNNILAYNGGYGLNYSIGSVALNDRVVRFRPDFNDYFSNTSGPVHNISIGPNSVTLDPQFTNASGGDFSIGTNLKGIGSPHAFLSTTTTAYVDIGAVQRQESGGGAAGMLFIPDMAAT